MVSVHERTRGVKRKFFQSLILIAIITPIPQVAAQATAVPESGPIRGRLDDLPEAGILERALILDPERFLLSGEFREQYESWRNREFGLIDEQDDDYLLQRLYLRADWRPNDWLQLTSEIGSSFQFASPFEPSPIDEDPAYFQQLYVQTLLYESDEWQLASTIGRQTLSLGSGRLVATRNGPNIRRSFDAARLRLTTNRIDSQLLFAADVLTGNDIFDNEPKLDRLLWGNYSTIQPGTFSLFPNLASDVYYLGYRNREAEFDSVSGEEIRHSFGLRFFGAKDGWDYNIEPVIQVGSIADQTILAWTAATIVGYTFDDLPFSPRTGLKFDVISGDSNLNDGRLGTFNALFPNNSYFSEAAIFVPANLLDLNLNAELELTETLNFLLLWDFLWRYSTDDAIYVPPGVPAIAGDSSNARYIGNTLSLTLEWRPIETLEVTTAYVHFEAGDAVTNAGGRSSDFFILWATLFF